jgi:hypothetical protein
MMNGERGDISVEVERKRSFLLRSVVDDVERVAGSEECWIGTGSDCIGSLAGDVRERERRSGWVVRYHPYPYP